MRITRFALGVAVAWTLSAGAHGAVTVFANGPGGDAFANATGTNLGQAVGASGWHYNNVRNSGVAGINGTYARNGNGSAHLETQIGPGGNSSKADIELLAAGTSVLGNFYAASSLGRLGDLTSLGYEWYRDSVSTNSALQHPVIRVLIDADGDLSTTNDRGGLVFEQAYNGSVVPTDTWVSEDVFAYNGGQGANVWNFGLGLGFAFGGYGNSLSKWANGQVSSAVNADSAVIGISLGVGSGWGPFKGAVDTVTYGFGTAAPTTTNFEIAVVPIPEPGAVLLGLLGLSGLTAARRRLR
jgi:hypothetical protein